MSEVYYRNISTRLWDDPRFCRLSHSAQLLYFRLATHYDLARLGWMRYSLDALAHDLKMSRRAIDANLRALADQGLLRLDADNLFLYFPHILKERFPANEKAAAGLAAQITLKMPTCPLALEMIAETMAALKARNTGLAAAFQSALPDELMDACRRMPRAAAQGELMDASRAMPAADAKSESHARAGAASSAVSENIAPADASPCKVSGNRAPAGADPGKVSENIAPAGAGSGAEPRNTCGQKARETEAEGEPETGGSPQPARLCGETGVAGHGENGRAENGQILPGYPIPRQAEDAISKRVKVKGLKEEGIKDSYLRSGGLAPASPPAAAPQNMPGPVPDREGEDAGQGGDCGKEAAYGRNGPAEGGKAGEARAGMERAERGEPARAKRERAPKLAVYDIPGAWVPADPRRRTVYGQVAKPGDMPEILHGRSMAILLEGEALKLAMADADFRKEIIATLPTRRVPVRGLSPGEMETLPTVWRVVYRGELAYWAGFFPGVDLEGEFRAMAAWFRANMDKLSPFNAIYRRITAWLGRARARGGGGGKEGEWQRIRREQRQMSGQIVRDILEEDFIGGGDA